MEDVSAVLVNENQRNYNLDRENLYIKFLREREWTCMYVHVHESGNCR